MANEGDKKSIFIHAQGGLNPPPISNNHPQYHQYSFMPASITTSLRPHEEEKKAVIPQQQASPILSIDDSAAVSKTGESDEALHMRMLHSSDF